MKATGISLWLTIFLCTNPTIRAKYSALDPKNPAKNFAFYELYPETPEGEKALIRGWNLIAKNAQSVKIPEPFSQLSVGALIKAINREGQQDTTFSEEELTFIETLASSLENRKLKGHSIWQVQQLRALPIEEIDLARAVFLEEYKEARKIRSYEALIDLMALQVLSQLPDAASPQEMIYAINHLIFHEMGFRFPAASAWEQEIDTYTGLPSVIDSKRGVCLGVSILYLCIAQRIGLCLEAVTPPGHIYVRYFAAGKQPINIETTARGIHISCDHYQGLELEKLETKTLFEVVGLVFVNEASVYWRKKDYLKAIALYEKALIYLPDDPLILDLLGYNQLFIGEIEKGRLLLEKATSLRQKHNLPPNSISQDYLHQKTSIEAIQAIFAPIDDSKSAILKKRSHLQRLLKKNPEFQAGLMQYAQTYLQLGKEKEALAPLEQLCKIQKNATTARYYLAMIYLNRYDYKRSWLCLQALKCVLKTRKKLPKMVEHLERSLKGVCPQPMCFDDTTEQEAGYVS